MTKFIKATEQEKKLTDKLFNASSPCVRNHNGFVTISGSFLEIGDELTNSMIVDVNSRTINLINGQYQGNAEVLAKLYEHETGSVWTIKTYD